MAVTQQQIDNLETAIAKGAVIQSMTVAGQTWQFRSIAEMQAALAWMKREVAAAAGTPSTRYAATSKGLD